MLLRPCVQHWFYSHTGIQALSELTIKCAYDFQYLNNDPNILVIFYSAGHTTDTERLKPRISPCKGPLDHTLISYSNVSSPHQK